MVKGQRSQVTGYGTCLSTTVRRSVYDLCRSCVKIPPALSSPQAAQIDSNAGAADQQQQTR